MRDEMIPLPVDSTGIYDVERLENDMTWLIVASSLIPNPNHAKIPSAAQFTLYFTASNLPPLGAAVYRIANLVAEEKLDLTFPTAVARSTRTMNDITNLKNTGYNIRANTDRNRHISELEYDFIVSNGIISVTFDR